PLRGPRPYSARTESRLLYSGPSYRSCRAWSPWFRPGSGPASGRCDRLWPPPRLKEHQRSSEPLSDSAACTSRGRRREIRSRLRLPDLAERLFLPPACCWISVPLAAIHRPLPKLLHRGRRNRLHHTELG